MRPVYVDIDLSSLLSKMGNIVRGVNLELAVIKFYKMKVDKEHNSLEVVNNYIANYLHMTKDRVYSYRDVTRMVKEKFYNKTLFKFHGSLEQLVLKSVNPYVTDVSYDKLINKDKMLVRFKLYYD